MKKLTRNVEFEKGAVLKHPKTLKLEIELELAGCPEATSHYATFTYQDCTVTVTEPKGDKELGDISCGLGATVFLSDAHSRYRYVIDPRHLWTKFQEALKNQHP